MNQCLLVSNENHQQLENSVIYIQNVAFNGCSLFHFEVRLSHF